MRRLDHTLDEPFERTADWERPALSQQAAQQACPFPKGAALVSPLLRFGRRTACVIMEDASCCCSLSLARARRCAMGPRNGLPGPAAREAVLAPSAAAADAAQGCRIRRAVADEPLLLRQRRLPGSSWDTP